MAIVGDGGDLVRLHRDRELRGREAAAAAAFDVERRALATEAAAVVERERSLQQRVIALLEEKARLAAELAAAPDLRAAVRAHEEDAVLARRDAVVAAGQLAEHRREAAAERALQQRHAEQLEQEAADERCKVAILEHRVSHAAAKLSRHDAVTDAVQRRADRCAAAVDDAAAKGDELRRAGERHAQERLVLEAKLSSAREARAAAEEGAARTEAALDVAERRAYRQRGLLQQAVWALASAASAPPPTDVDAHGAVQRFLDGHPSAAHEPRGHGSEGAATPPGVEPQSPLRRLVMPAALPPADDPTSEALTKLRRLLGSCPAERVPVLLRRFCDSAFANDSARREGAGGFCVAGGLPPPDEEPAAIVAQLAAVTNDRDSLLVEVTRLRRTRAEALSSGDGSIL